MSKNASSVLNHRYCFMFASRLCKVRLLVLVILREFEIKLENRQLSVIDKIYVNGGLLFKKQYAAIAGVGYKVIE